MSASSEATSTGPTAASAESLIASIATAAVVTTDKSSGDTRLTLSPLSSSTEKILCIVSASSVTGPESLFTRSTRLPKTAV